MGSSTSLRRYIYVRLMSLVLVVVLIGMWVHWVHEAQLLESQFDKGLKDKAATLATLVTETGGKLQLQFADEFMPEYARGVDPYMFQVWYPDGRVLERSHSLGGEDLPFRFGDLGSPEAFEHRQSAGELLRCIGVQFPVRLGADSAAGEVSSVVIVVGTSRKLLARYFQQGAREVILTGAVSIVGLLLAMSLVLRKSVGLLHRIGDEVDSISSNSLARSLDVEHAPIEIRPIIESLNRMKASIYDHVEMGRRFNTNVAHELRTPIAELRAVADVAFRWPEDTSTRDLARESKEIAEHMTRLVESLLELSSLESIDAEGPTEAEFDLAKCIALLVDQASRVEAGGRRIELSSPSELRLRSNETLWTSAARNLLDNALNYSPEGSVIQVDLSADRDGARLSLTNPTDELEPHDVERCTERLWRASPTSDGAHFGLGLSIVTASVAKLGHGFEVGMSDGRFKATISTLSPSWETS